MRRTSLGIIAIVILAQPAFAQDLAIPKFEDETQSSGIDSVYAGEWQYMVGGGVASFDCDADGFPDMLLAGGEAPSKFYRNASTKGGPLKFEIAQSGLELNAVTGAYPLEIDSDGITDVVELRVGETVVMRGLGDCKFERANEAWNFDGGDAWWTAFSATWESGSNWPTFALGSYIDRTQDIEPWGSCTDNWLERPDWTGGFAAPLPLKPSFCPLAALFTDWNNSGHQSLRLANDREYYTGGQEQMWKLDPGQPPVLYTAKDGWKPLKIWGMGIASADVTGDGYPDYFITSMADNKLQTLTAPPTDGTPPKPDYKDVAFPRAAIAQRPYTGTDVRPSTAWHTQFEDVNNDGRMDLFIAKGNVSTMPDFAAEDPNNLLLQGADGKFVEVGDKAGIASMMVGRGGALVDFNLDGQLDLVVVNRWTTAQLWRNVTESPANWIALKPRRTGFNLDAIGGWIEVKVGDAITRREITSGGGHVSGQLGWWHFGLGPATDAQVRVTWPGGAVDEWQTVAADGFYVLPAGKPAEPWSPG